MEKYMLRKGICVSFLIVNWNGKHLLDDCIQSIQNLNFPKNQMEIILIDNGSKDGSYEFIRNKYPQIKIIRLQKNYGFPEANNYGIKVAKGKYIAMVNNDVVLDRNWIKFLIEKMEKNKKIAAIGGKVLLWNEKNPAYNHNNQILCSWVKINPITGLSYNFTYDLPYHKVDYLSGSAMLLRNSIFNKIGLFDKDYFAYYEETEIAARLIRIGKWVVYHPQAICWHKVSSTAMKIDLNFQPFMIERNRLRFVIKNFDKFYILIFLEYFIVKLLKDSLKIVFNAIKNKLIFTSQEKKHSNYVFSLLVRFSFHSLKWNIINLFKTLHKRITERKILKKTISYNKNLPLRNYGEL